MSSYENIGKNKVAVTKTYTPLADTNMKKRYTSKFKFCLESLHVKFYDVVADILFK